MQFWLEQQSNNGNTCLVMYIISEEQSFDFLVIFKMKQKFHVFVPSCQKMFSDIYYNPRMRYFSRRYKNFTCAFWFLLWFEKSFFA